MEVMQTPIKQQLDIIYRPHPLLPAADCQFNQQAWQQGQCVRDILLANGVDPHQLIVIVIDDRLLTVDEWDTVCPMPGQIINVKAEVADGGGGGGSNPLQIVILVAVVVAAVYTGGLAAEAYAAAYGAGAAATAVGAGVTAVVGIAGSMIVNSVFAAQTPSTSMASASGQYSAASPTYSLSGAQNRMRPYESMSVVMGAHRLVPDMATRPYTEYHGEDQYLYQIFHLGLSSLNISDWKIGTNPISNYTDYSWCYQNAYGNINNFPNNVDSTPGAALENSAGWIQRTTSSNTYRIGIDIEGSLYYANDSGGLDATSVQIRVQYRPTGAGYWVDPDRILTTGSGFTSGRYETYQVWVESGDWGWTEGEITDEWGNSYWGSYYGWIDTSHYETRSRFVAGSGGTVIVSGNSQTTRRSTLLIDVPVGTYDVRVIRDTADSTDARRQDKTSWSTLRSYQTDNAANNSRYIGQNRQGIIIKASEQLNGTISQLSCMASAWALWWTGYSWTWSQTSNPAHWFMDFAKGRYDSSGNLLYGIGLSDSQIDLAGLHAWGDFCYSEGLSFNAVIDRDQTAADLLNAIARCGFASPTWSSGKLGVVWDARNAAPAMAFGMSNIIRGSFEVSYITEQLAEEIIVRFENPDKDWGQDEVRVNVPGVTNPQRTSTIDLFGCTNQTMAGKFANYLAAQQHYRRRRIKWECDFEGFVAGRGDVVLLSHDLTQWGYSGRIVSVSGNTLTLDRTVPRNGSTEYLMLKRPDGTMTTYTVAAGSGESDTITLNSAPSIQGDCLPMDHIWFFSPLATPGKKVKILSISPVSESRVQVIATDEDPEFYAAWDGNWRSPAQQTLLTKPYVTVSNVVIDEALVLSASTVISKVVVSWRVVSNQALNAPMVRYKLRDGVWRTPDSITASEATIYVRNADVVTVEITESGVSAKDTATASKAIYCRSLPPSDVQNLALNVRSGVGLLTFDPSVDLDVQYGGRLWLRHTTGTTDAKWENAVDVAVVVPGNATSCMVLPQTGTYLAKWVDSDGNASTNATLLSTSYAAIEQLNVYETVAGHPAWAGAKTNMAYDSGFGGIVLDSAYMFDSIIDNIDTWKSFSYYNGVSSFGIYELGIIDVGQVYDCILTIPQFKVETYDSITDFDSRTESIDTWPWFNGAGSDDGNAAIYVRMTNDDPNGGTAVWSEWQLLSGGVSLRARGFQLQIRAFSTRSNVNIVVQQCAVSVDMPDRQENGEDIPSGAAVKSILFGTPFIGPVNLGITAQNMASGDYYAITSKSQTGFSIEFRNSSNALVSRTFDYIAKSY